LLKTKFKSQEVTTDINGIQLDRDNVEFNNATEFVLHTDTIVYLTGKAGTGKTTLLKHVQQITHKNTVVH
jgi:ABC-type lipoprotein export system ATPase subunit